MNAIIPRSLELDPRDRVTLLISISDCGERSNNVREFMETMRREVVQSGMPVFAISLVHEEEGQSLLLTSADLCRLDHTAMADGGSYAEVNIMTRQPLPGGRPGEAALLGPCLDGAIIKTPGIVIDDTIQWREYPWKTFLDYYSSLSPMVSRICGTGSGREEVIALPIRCGERVVGVVQFLCGGPCSLTAEGYREMLLLCRVMGTAYGSFINRLSLHSTQSKYRAIFDSAPLAILVLDRGFNVIEENGRFLSWYGTRAGADARPFVLPDTDESDPFSRIHAAQTFAAGKGLVRDIPMENGGGEVYRVRTSPILSDAGEVSAVMEIIEDITIQAQEERSIKARRDELEFEVSRKIEALEEKERNLTILVHTVRGLEGASGRAESIERIVRGYEDLAARSVFFLYNEFGTLVMETVAPRTMNRWLSDALAFDPVGLSYPMSDMSNPFACSLEMNNPVFYVGADGISEFCSSVFTGVTEDRIRGACRILKGMSVVVLPMETKSGKEGVIAIAAEQEKIEDNFEYYLLLSSSAAVEMSRLRGAENLRCSELRYRNLVETSRDMITLCDMNGRIQFCNNAFFERTGLVQADFAEYSIYDLFPGSGRTRLETHMKSCLEGTLEPGPMEIMMRSPLGAEIWTELSINNVSGGVPACQIVLRDITSRKTMELAIGSLTAFQEKILQNELIGIITMTPAGIITNWNRGATNILGFTETEVQNRSFLEFVITPDKPRGESTRDHAAKIRKGGEIHMRRKDGSGIHVMYFETVMKDSRNRPSVVIAFFFDVTDKVKLEKESKDLVTQLTQAQNITILSLARLTEYRDLETGSHLERIMRYTEILASELARFKMYKDYISDDYVRDLVNSCPLHDIGKVGIPDQILHKPGRLTAEEFEVMKNHTVIGGDTIQEAEEKLQGRSYLLLGKEVAYYHHEKWDGTGYPRGLRGEEIPLSARIVAVADVYDALTSRRPYKDAFPHETAVEIINASAGTHFDQSIVKAFMNREKDFRQYSMRVH